MSNEITIVIKEDRDGSVLVLCDDIDLDKEPESSVEIAGLLTFRCLEGIIEGVQSGTLTWGDGDD